jgi:hypothetical protein
MGKKDKNSFYDVKFSDKFKPLGIDQNQKTMFGKVGQLKIEVITTSSKVNINELRRYFVSKKDAPRDIELVAAIQAEEVQSPEIQKVIKRQSELMVDTNKVGIYAIRFKNLKKVQTSKKISAAIKGMGQ